MRTAIALVIASFAAAGCYASGSSPENYPATAPPSSITVAAPTGTITGSAAGAMVQNQSDCPPAIGIGVRAAANGAAVTVLFPRWPAEGAVFDLSAPGASDDVVVSAVADGHAYCVADTGAAGTVLVNHFDAAGGRYLVDVELSGVTAGASTVDAHLYH